MSDKFKVTGYSEVDDYYKECLKDIRPVIILLIIILLGVLYVQ